MNPLTRADLVETLKGTDGDVVSIYMPTHTGAESRQNAIRLKNLLRTAEQQLSEKQVDGSDVREMLAPAWELVEQGGAWSELGKGLALLIGGDGTRRWHPPVACEERCVVGKNYYVLPLVTWLNDDAPYYVLAVSQNQVRLLRGTRGEIAGVEVPGMPPNREDALHLDDPEPTQQAHVSRPQVPGKGDLMYHGHGGAPDAAKEELESFLREIDRVLAKFLRLETEPLIFAGVDYLFPIYQHVNNYAQLLPTPIVGNPELLSGDELRQKAWPLAESMSKARREAELEKYGNSIARGRAMNVLEDILVAADAGAVETLFVAPGVQKRGEFIPETSTVRVDDSPDASSEDLVNLAATLVLRSSGWVEALAPGEVPGGGEMAAVLRYPFPPAAKRAESNGARKR